MFEKISARLVLAVACLALISMPFSYVQAQEPDVTTQPGVQDQRNQQEQPTRQDEDDLDAINGDELQQDQAQPGTRERPTETEREAREAELPATAGHLPLLALVGGLALAARLMVGAKIR